MGTSSVFVLGSQAELHELKQHDGILVEPVLVPVFCNSDDHYREAREYLDQVVELNRPETLCACSYDDDTRGSNRIVVTLWFKHGLS